MELFLLQFYLILEIVVRVSRGEGVNAVNAVNAVSAVSAVSAVNG